MPYLPPRVVQTNVIAPYSHLVHYNGYGAPKSELEQQPGESKVAYALRMSKVVLPTVSELIAGKSAAEQIAILEAKVEQIRPFAAIPLVGEYFKGRLNEYLKRIEALRKAEKAESTILDAKVVLYAVLAIGGILGLGYSAIKLVKATKRAGELDAFGHTPAEQDRIIEEERKRRRR